MYRERNELIKKVCKDCGRTALFWSTDIKLDKMIFARCKQCIVNRGGRSSSERKE